MKISDLKLYEKCLIKIKEQGSLSFEDFQKRMTSFYQHSVDDIAKDKLLESKSSSNVLIPKNPEILKFLRENKDAIEEHLAFSNLTLEQFINYVMLMNDQIDAYLEGLRILQGKGIKNLYIGENIVEGFNSKKNTISYSYAKKQSSYLVLYGDGIIANRKEENKKGVVINLIKTSSPFIAEKRCCSKESDEEIKKDLFIPSPVLLLPPHNFEKTAKLILSPRFK